MRCQHIGKMTAIGLSSGEHSLITFPYFDAVEISPFHKMNYLDYLDKIQLSTIS